MNYTTIEQSKKLLELGLNTKSADMCYSTFGVEDYPLHLTLKDKGKFTPCWSLSALWNLIPDIPACTVLFAKSEGKYGICITPLDSGLALNEIEASTPLKAVYDMVVWLLKNGYIKTKKK